MRKLSLALIIITTITLIGTNVSANNEIIIQGTLLGSKQDKIETLKHELKVKTKAFDADKKVGSEKIERVETELKTLAEEVAELNKSVESLNDMFVKIDKYAPDAAGMGYPAGQCTNWVKQKRPDIGNYWGNANMWYQNAKAQGWNVGYKAKKGAIATTTDGYYGHVAYVEKVSLDGEYVTISELNYGAPGAYNERTVLASDFRYIYELN